MFNELHLQLQFSIIIVIISNHGLSTHRCPETRVVVVVVVVVTRSDQPKPPAVAIVRQNGLSPLAAGPQSL